MAPEKLFNEYGHFLYQSFLDTPKDRVIVYLHDHLDNPDIFNDFADELKLFHYYSFALPGDDMFEANSLYKNSYHYTCQYVRDLLLSLNGKEYFIIAHGTAAPIAVFLANILPSKIKKISLINPFTSKSSVEVLKWVSTLPRNLEDMVKVLERMYYKNDYQIFSRGIHSTAVVKRMQNVYHYWEDIANYVESLIQLKVLEQIRLYEENLRCPLQLILGEDDAWIPPHESIYSFNKYNQLSVVQIPKAMHYPLHDNKKTTTDAIMKFFIKDLGLNNKNRLPNKYLYNYLDDEWKRYYRTTFAEKLNSRDLEEYEKKMKEYEKSQPSIKFAYEEYPEFLQEHAKNQTKALNDIYNMVDENYKQIQAYNNQMKQQMHSMIQIDYSTPANVITVNAQGYEVFHDGKGKGFYRLNNSDWKMIKNK